jgi:hypothetical protein
MLESSDGWVFNSPEECEEHELFLRIRSLHKILLKLDFYRNIKVTAYKGISDLQPKLFGTGISMFNTLFKSPSVGFLYRLWFCPNNLEKDIYVRLKPKGQKILILSFVDVEDATERRVIHHGNIPLSWLGKSEEEIKILANAL